jgi:D-alanine-D-alanine ligase
MQRNNQLASLCLRSKLGMYKIPSAEMEAKMKIVVLAGGTSTERDVSLSTGSMIYKALKSRGHRVVLLDVYLGYEGDITNIFDMDKDWAANIGSIQESNPDIKQIKALRKDNPDYFFGSNVIDICSKADISFLALHGANGEDGKIQAAFDLMGIKYTGTDYTSSALAMDKAITKELFAFHKIPTPMGIHVKKGEAYTWNAYPCVVKVSCGGSSVGVSIAKSADEMENALANAFAYGNEVVIEEYIKGREFSVGVIDKTALPVIEIAPLSGFYDYKNKYQAGSTIETCPARLSGNVSKKMQNVAVAVFEALRLKTYARVDFLMNEKDELFCLEANTLPGMTPVSLLPQEAKVIGVDFETLCEKIIEISMKKYTVQ